MDDPTKSMRLISDEFKRMGISDPVIVIRDRAEAFTLHSRLRLNSDYWVGQVGTLSDNPMVDIDGCVWHEMQVCGIKIRWPAELMRSPKGKAWV